MGKKVLSIVESAYRGTVEEQDDTILWLNNMFRGAELDVTLLLRSNAVNYAVAGQDASGLSFGGRTNDHPPKIDEDVEALIAKGVDVYYVAEDAAERGIGTENLVGGVKSIGSAELAGFLGRFDQIWHW